MAWTKVLSSAVKSTELSFRREERGMGLRFKTALSSP
jgi:hypothetical protein